LVAAVVVAVQKRSKSRSHHLFHTKVVPNPKIKKIRRAKKAATLLWTMTTALPNV
jgi:hypothetical protein